MPHPRINRPLTYLFTLVVAASFTSFTTAEVIATGSKPSLDGSWRAEVSSTQSLLLEIQGTKVALKGITGEATIPLWTAKLVFSKAHPDSEFDWIEIRAGERALPDNKCLYRLAGNTLLIIGGGPSERPKHFVSGPGGEPRTLVFTREKPVAK